MAFRWAYNGEAFGTGHAVRGVIGNPSINVAYDQRSFSARGRIAGTTTALLDTEWGQVRDALMSWSRNLGVTMGVRLSVTDGVTNGTATVTSATGGFAATDVGLPILVGSDLVQVATFVDGNEITVSETLATNSSLTIEIGYTQLRIIDGDTGLLCRPTAGKPGGEDLDTELTRVIQFDCTWEHPADDANDTYRREATWDLTFEDSRKRVLTINGLYTAEGGTGARSRYDSNIAAFVTTVFSDLSLTEGNYELVSEQTPTNDDEDALLRFTRVYREIFWDQSSAGLNHTSVKQPVVSFTRIPGATLGKNQQPVMLGALSFQCDVDHDNTTASGLASLWTGTIKPHLISEIASHWTGSVVVEAESTNLDPESSTISSSMSVILHSSARNLMAYSRRVTQRWVSNDVWRKLHDGEDHTYTRYGPGGSIFGNEVISVVSLGSSYAFPEAAKVLERPEAVVDPKAGAAQWHATDRELAFEKEFKGLDIDGLGSNLTANIRVFTRNLIWAKISTGGGKKGGPTTGGPPLNVIVTG